MRKQDTFACERLRRLLPDYADGELNKRQATAVKRHVANCPSCADELKQLCDLSALIAEAGKGVEPPAWLHASVMSAVHAMPQTTARRTGAPLWRKLGTVAACFVCVIAVAIVLVTSGALNGKVFESDMWGGNMSPDAEMPMSPSQEDATHVLTDKSESDEPDDPAEDIYGGEPSDSMKPDMEDGSMADMPNGTIYVLKRLTPIESNVPSDSLAAQLDGEWEGDGLFLSLVTKTGVAKLCYGGGESYVGTFVLRDNVLTVLTEGVERQDFLVELKEGMLWLTCK